LGKSAGSSSPVSLPRLLAHARRASRRAYAPYSGFAVGAAIEDVRGRCYLGANIENAAFPLGVCAERVAITEWRAAGGAPIRRIVVSTGRPTPTPPCGLCRDALLRWAPEAEVYLAFLGSYHGPFSPSEWLPGGAEGR
jgi:cytidine deaminase